MQLASAIAVFVGAGFGALLRWALGMALNQSGAPIALGTLAANVLGGLLMGMLLVGVQESTAFSPLLRIGLTTGFLGGLTTFSAFSAESFDLIARQHYALAGMHSVLHVGASLVAVYCGFALAKQFAT